MKSSDSIVDVNRIKNGTTDTNGDKNHEQKNMSVAMFRRSGLFNLNSVVLLIVGEYLEHEVTSSVVSNFGG